MTVSELQCACDRLGVVSDVDILAGLSEYLWRQRLVNKMMRDYLPMDGDTGQDGELAVLLEIAESRLETLATLASIIEQRLTNE